MLAPYSFSSSAQSTSSVSSSQLPTPVLQHPAVNESKGDQVSSKISVLATKTLSTELVPALLMNFTLNPCQLAVNRAWNSPLAKQMLIDGFRQAAFAKGFLPSLKPIPVNPNAKTKSLHEECIEVVRVWIEKSLPEDFISDDIPTSTYEVLLRMRGLFRPCSILRDIECMSTNLMTYSKYITFSGGEAPKIRFCSSVWEHMITTALLTPKTCKYTSHSDEEVKEVRKVKNFQYDYETPENVKQSYYLKICDQITNCISVNNQIEPSVYSHFHEVLEAGLVEHYVDYTAFDETISTYALLTYLSFILRQNISMPNKDYIKNCHDILRSHMNKFARLPSDKEVLRQLLEAFIERAASNEVQAYMVISNNLAYENNLKEIQKMYQCFFGIEKSQDEENQIEKSSQCVVM